MRGFNFEELPANLLCALLLAAAFAAAEEPQAADNEAVIPPGREAFLAEMLGQGATLPGQCAFSGGQIERTVVRARYGCPGGEVVFELRHPSAAPAVARQTGRFAIAVLSGSAPPDLVSALEARIRSREAGFEWNWQLSDRRRPPSRATVPLAAAGLLALMTLAWVLRRRMRASCTALHSGVAAVVALSVLLCAAVHAALRATGALFTAVLRAESSVQLMLCSGLVVALAAASLLAAALLARRVSRRPLRAWVAVVVLAYFVAGYQLSLLPADLYYFGSLSTYSPNSSVVESVPGRAPITYRINPAGFREPTFDDRKPDGVIRIALIGDSYVFGIGVENEGTLRSQLEAELSRRWPRQRFEVLNLGMPGNNLASHVELFAIATARFEPDAVVLCLTLPNDLSRWDEQVARRDARHFSLFSLARFLTGDAATSFWAFMFLDRAVTPAGLKHLDQQMSRLDEIRRRSPSPRVLVLFAFSPWDPAIAGRLREMSGIALVPDHATLPGEFIPGDGHPTAFGNGRSAVRIADALAEDPSWRGLLQRAQSS